MSSAILCDGCETVIKGPPVRVGHIHTCDYCESCAPIAKDMLSQVDSLHDRLAETWESKTAEIKQAARTKLKAIPDEEAVAE